MEILNFQDGGELILNGDINITLEYLTDTIARIKHATSSNSLYNEAYSKALLDQIRIAPLYEENLTSQSGQDGALQMHHAHPPKAKAPIDKIQLSRRIVFKGEERILTGFADYSLYFESQTKAAFATNLIIVEAKKIGFADGALPQLVSYIGIVFARK